MAEVMYSKIGTNVTYEVLAKCCYFSCRSEIQYGHSDPWLTDIFSTSSQEGIQGSTPSLAQMYLTGSWPSVVTLYVDQNPVLPSLPLIGW